MVHKKIKKSRPFFGHLSYPKYDLPARNSLIQAKPKSTKIKLFSEDNRNMRFFQKYSFIFVSGKNKRLLIFVSL
jgi:hypothetical protein